MEQLQQDELLKNALFAQESSANVEGLRTDGMTIIQNVIGCSAMEAAKALRGLEDRKLITPQFTPGGINREPSSDRPQARWMWGKPIDD